MKDTFQINSYKTTLSCYQDKDTNKVTTARRRSMVREGNRDTERKETERGGKKKRRREMKRKT